MDAIMICSGGHPLRVTAKHAGTKVRCPRCQAVLQVPLPLETATLSAAHTVSQASAPAGGLLDAVPVDPTDKVPRQRRGVTRILLTSASVLLIALVVCYFVWPSKRETVQGTALPSPSRDSTSGNPESRKEDAGTSGMVRLPGPKRELSEWLVAGAPFDVKKLFSPVPPEDNAASLYLEAFAEFGGEMVTCVPENEREAFRDRLQRRSKELNALLNAWDKDPGSVSRGDLDRLLPEYDVAFQKLAQAQERPSCDFEQDFSVMTLLPHIQTARSGVANVVRLQQARDLERGQYERAISTTQLMLRLSRDLRPRGVIITQLVSLAIDGMTMKRILELLESPGCTPSHCDRLLSLLQQHEREAWDALAAGLQTEYLMFRKIIREVETRAGDFAPENLPRWSNSNNQTLTIGEALEGLCGNFAFQENSLAETGAGREARARRAGQIDARLALMSAADYEREYEAQKYYFAAVLDVAAQPYPQQVAAMAKLKEKRAQSLFLGLYGDIFEPQIRAVARSKANLHGTIALVALRRWRFDHPGEPTSLEEVTRAAGLTAVPLDPYSGGPLRMTRVAGQAVVYSIGSDGRDDHALVDWNNGQQPGDFIFRLEIHLK